MAKNIEIRNSTAEFLIFQIEGGGWLLITHSNNRMKKAFIENVSEVLHLGIKVTLKE